MNGRGIKSGEIRFPFWAYLAIQQSQLSVAEGTPDSPCQARQGLSSKELCASYCIPREEESLTRKGSRHFLCRQLRRQGNLPSRAGSDQRDKGSCLHATHMTAS